MVTRKQLEEIYKGEMKFTATWKAGETFVMSGVEFVITDVGINKDGDFWLDFRPTEEVTDDA